jgi:hypothetical protein
MFLFPLIMHHTNSKKKNRQLHKEVTSNTKFTSLIITHSISNFNPPYMAPIYYAIIISYKATSMKHYDYVFLP